MNIAATIAAFMVGVAAGAIFDGEVMQPLIRMPVPVVSGTCNAGEVVQYATSRATGAALPRCVPAEKARCFDLNGPENTDPHAWNDAMFAGRSVCQ